MKTMKRITSVVLVAAMSITMMATAPTVTTQAKKIAVKKKISLTVGEANKITVKGKGVTYSSSDKKIATVSKKGKVTGKSIGTCKVVVKQGNAKVTTKVTVRPAKVSLKDVTIVGENSGTSAAQKATIKATWKKVKGASGYYVYYGTSKKGKFAKKTVKGGKKTSLKISGLAYGKTYFVKVKAFGGKKKIASDSYSKVLSVKTWSLSWGDEFNGNKLDTSAWKYETEFTGWGSSEPQQYTAGDNIKFKDGSLVIIPRMKITGSKTEYTSTKITTAGQHAFKYGKMEIRAKASKGNRTWSAGWMLGDGTGDSRGWPYDGEIDLFDSNDLWTSQGVCCDYYNNMASAKGGSKSYSTGLSKEQATEGYHTYGIIWTDKDIQFTVDGVNKGKYDSTKFSADVYEKAWKGTFDHPFYFILNCAIDRNDNGKVATEGWTKINDNLYEDYFYIDYVRVFQ